MTTEKTLLSATVLCGCYLLTSTTTLIAVDLDFQTLLMPVPQAARFADPNDYIWHNGERFQAIVKDNAGHFTGRGKSTALFESNDGLTWTVAWISQNGPCGHVPCSRWRENTVVKNGTLKSTM